MTFFREQITLSNFLFYFYITGYYNLHINLKIIFNFYRLILHFYCIQAIQGLFIDFYCISKWCLMQSKNAIHLYLEK